MPDPDPNFPHGSHAEPVETRHGVVADDNMLGQDELAGVDEDFAPQATPYPKVQAAGFGGAVVTVLIFGLSIAGVEVPAEVAAASATLVAYAAAYVRTE
jgi:hypothetical protein